MAATNQQSFPRKIGKNVREKLAKMSAKKSAKMSAKNRQKCPRKIGKNVGDKLAKMFAKITRENVQNLQNYCLQNYF
jgi:hypothetical protein